MERPKRKYYDIVPTLKGCLFIAALVFIFAFLIYTRGVIRRMSEEEKRLSRTFANLYAFATSQLATEQELSVTFQEIITKTDFPIILTDVEGNVRYWKGVGIAPEDTTETARQSLGKMVVKMDRQNDPIPLEAEEFGGIWGYIHYGDSGLVHRLGWLPFIEIAAILLFGFIGFLGFRHIKNSEQRYIWVGMAKEAAHQLGTPISSLFGWLELIRSKTGNKTGLGQIIGEMENDVHRLNKVASRFSQIGSVPELERQNIVPIVSETVDYFQKRLPQLRSKVQISERYELVPDVPLNKELLGWAFENLFKNSLDAIKKSDGRIKVSVKMLPDQIMVDFWDNGRGLSSKQQKTIFLPGYTTKKRGWGLGLTFVKRIIEEYHDGKIFVEKSSPKQGTTIRILLPVL